VLRIADLYRDNTETTTKLVSAAERAGVTRFLLVSSLAAGGGGQALDLCEQVGLQLSSCNEAVYAGLRAVLPDFIPVSNPMDLTAQALVDPELYRRTLAVLLGDDSFGSVVLGLILTDKATSDLKLPSVIGAIKDLKPTKPVIFAGLDEGADVPQAYIDELRALGIPCFPSAERAFRALAHLAAVPKPIQRFNPAF